MPWQAGEQPLQRDQQPLVRAGSVHAAGNRHHPKIHLRQDCWWVLTDLSITWMYVKRDVNVAIYFARREEQLRYQTKLESIDLKATVLQCLAKTLTKMKLRTTRVAKYIIWVSDNLRTWLLLFHTFSWAWESEFRILSSSQLWTRSPAIGRKCPRRNIFYQEASSREESCWDWFQMTKPSWSIECYFSLESKTQRWSMSSRGGSF